MEKIGFIGTGNMGFPMCKNLLKANYEVKVFDISKAALKRVVDVGATEAASLSDLAKESDVVFTMLPGPDEVKEVFLKEGGLIQSRKDGAILIDSSTIDPITSRELSEAGEKVNTCVLDAPVSGGTFGAEQGTLAFMVGGDLEAFQKVEKILAAMGKNVIYCGESGNGQSTKLCNNMAAAINMAGLSEAISLGCALGLDPKKLTDVMNASSGRSFMSEVYHPYPGIYENIPSSKAYEGGFSTNLMLKDVSLAIQSGKAVKKSLILGALAQQLFQLWSSMGYGIKDFSSIIQMYMGEK